MKHIDSKHNFIIIKQAKGRKDGLVPPGTKILDLLWEYCKLYRPWCIYLREVAGRPYSERSLQQMKRVLIITYYWPPAGGIGVQRWLQFSKNLPEHGWTPVIFTAENANYPIIDPKLNEQVPGNMEIHRVRVPEPNNILSLFQKKSNGNKQIYKLQQQSGVDNSIFKKMLWKIRGNFFIPDARMFWQGPSYQYLKKYLSENRIDAIITTGPPHTTHLIGQKLKQEFKIPWVADFRDPWTSMDYLKKMGLSDFARRKHERLEKSVVLNATRMVVVGKTIQREFKEKYDVDSLIIYNGYANSQPGSNDVQLDTKFSIAHVGSFLHNRNCADLWECLSELTKTNSEFAKDLKIKLVGKIAPVVLQTLEEFGLTSFLTIIDQVDHESALKIQRSAQLLLLPIDRIENAEFVLSGKLFEYLQAKRPILLIGPPGGDAAQVIRDCLAGEVCNFNDMFALKKSVLSFYEKFRSNENFSKSVNINQFAYKNLTTQIANLLESIV